MSSASNNDTPPQDSNSIGNIYFIDKFDDEQHFSYRKVTFRVLVDKQDAEMSQTSSNRSDYNNHVTTMASLPGDVSEASSASSVSPELQNSSLTSEILSDPASTQRVPTASTHRPNISRRDIEQRFTLLDLSIACQTPLPSSQNSDGASYFDSESDEDSGVENAEQNWFSEIIDGLDASELDNEDTSRAPTYPSSGNISPLTLPIPIPAGSSLDLLLGSSQTLQTVEEVKEVQRTLEVVLDAAQAQEEREWQEVYFSNSQEVSQDLNAPYVPELVVRALHPKTRPLPGMIEAGMELPRRKSSLLSIEVKSWEVKEGT